VGVDAQLLLVASTSAGVQRKSVEVVVDYLVLCYNNFSDVGDRFLFSDVINFRLETVIIPR